MLWAIVWGCAGLGEQLETSTERPDPWLDAELAGRAPVEQPPAAPAEAVLFHGARIYDGAGLLLEEGWLLLEEGRISALGSGEPPAAEGISRRDLEGKTLTPGLIDTHSHLGVYPSPWAKAHSDGNEATSPTTPGVWAEHSFWPQDPGLERAIAGGVTTLQVLPGSANLIGGRGVVLHNTPQRGSRAMRLAGAPETVKMACGENPKRVYGNRNSSPSTRMGNLRAFRQAFLDAQDYGRSWDEYADKLAAGEEDASPPKRDLNKDTLLGVLRGEFLPQIHCYRADDMISVMQVADEMGFEVRSFHHALEAYKIRDLLAERDIAVSTWADWWGFKLEAWDGIPDNLAMVHDAGGRAVVHSDSAEGIQRLNQEAAKGLRAGTRMGLEITPAEAMAWITLNPAWALGVEDQVGSLEPGKRADVVVWSEDPFSVYSQAEEVYIDGALRWDRTQESEVWSDFQQGWEVK